MRTLFGACLLLVALAGCGQVAPAAPNTALGTTQPTIIAVTAAPATPVVPVATPQPPIIEQARQLLAAHLGVAASALTVQQVEAHEWPNTALDCPDPATTYLQAITPGYQIMFSNGGTSYDVRTAQTKETVIMCENNKPTPLFSDAAQEPTAAAAAPTSTAHIGPPAAQLPTAPAGQPGNAVVPAGAQPLVDQARALLAQSAGVAANAVQLINVEEVEWNNSSLGCPQPGTMYSQVITPGFRITLEANGTRYVYHTDTRKNVIRCTTPTLGGIQGTATK